MSVRVRMAPSPTGLLHIGNVRTALFNWLFARHEGGEFLLRIENTDTDREVEAATEQIQESLRWLGLDWDGPVTFQMDSLETAQKLAHQLLEEGKAYEDEGAIRFRMPEDGVTAWDDVVLGRIEYPNKEIEDTVILRSDGRPTYNFASPVEDVLIKPPTSRVGPLTPMERTTLIQTDIIGAKYDTLVDRESAEEILAAKHGEAAAAAAAAKATTDQQKADAEQAKVDARAAREKAQADALTQRTAIAAQREADRQAKIDARPSTTEKMIQSAARAAASSVGRQLTSSLLRGILGGFLRR